MKIIYWLFDKYLEKIIAEINTKIENGDIMEINLLHLGITVNGLQAQKKALESIRKILVKY